MVNFDLSSVCLLLTNSTQWCLIPKQLSIKLVYNDMLAYDIKSF